jgi:hypothetical protein
MWTTKQLKAVEALLTAGNLQLAAQAAGVSISTLRRWRQLPAFQEALAAERREIFSLTRGTLAAGMLEGLATLRSLALHAHTPPAVRVTASIALVKFALAVYEQESIEERLHALEARLNELAAETQQA